MPKISTNLIGRSAAFQKALDAASVAARNGEPVLVYGETGSGKGVVAEYIHRKSGATGRLVSLNCATFQANLFESELFGYMKGAFTGAVKDTPGLFEAAEGGTLFLDEIGDTPLEIQPKLLRAIEEGVVRRVGGTKEIAVDVRLVCATNRDLKTLIAEGKFREDLFYRINSFVVTLPPLRERPDDIPLIARHFVAEHDAPGAQPRVLSIDAIEALQSYDWPGNVRELRSAIAFACAQAADRRTISSEDLPPTVTETPAIARAESDHVRLFRELYRTGAEDRELWARFLLALNAHLGSARFTRGDMLECLRAVRGPEPTNNSLVNEWQRQIKPIPLRLGLVHEEGKKLRIDLEACENPSDFEPVDDLEQEITETLTAAPPPLAMRGQLTNISPSRTTFVGRSRELQQLQQLLMGQPENLVTLTGPGGTGKTRIALECGRMLVGALPGGAWFADLTEARNVEGVAYAVAHALRLPLTTNQSPELLVRAMLEARPPSLLILDNFEQVVETASHVVADWVRAAPQVRFLVTSRALLGIEGERELEVPALPLPREDAGLESIARSEAVRLFVERARLQHVGFTLDESSAAAVARIVQRLEGMPLAIELAAARTMIMKPEQIAERMDRLFEVLTSSRRDLAPRQRSLTALLSWSYDLLSDSEKWAFAQLSNFRGGFFIEAAEVILDLSRFPDAPQPLDVIQSLREKSLLRALETPYETRFAMYQVISEYAQKCWLELADEAERARTSERLARYYLEYGQEWDRRTNTEDVVEALDRLDYARDNIAAALDFVAANPGLEDRRSLFVGLSLNFTNLLRMRGPAAQRVPVLRRALEFHGDEITTERVRLLFLLSLAEREAGDPVAGSALAYDAVAAAEKLGDEAMLATAKFHLAGIEYAADNVERAQELHREVLPIFRRLGNRHNEARVLSRMALLEANLGSFEDAIGYSIESEKVLRELGDLPGAAWALTNRGSIYNRFGRHKEALHNIERAEAVYRELDDRRMLCLCLGNRALMTRQVRDFATAERLVAECNELAREIGDQITLGKNLMNAGIMYIELERDQEAARNLRDAAKIFEGTEHPHMLATCVENLAFIDGRRGDIEAALQGYERALDLYGRKDDSNSASVYGGMAETLLAHGRHEEALTAVERALAFWRGHAANAHRDYFRALTTHARLTNDAASRAEALKLAERIYLTDTDASPQVRESLKFLRNNASV